MPRPSASAEQPVVLALAARLERLLDERSLRPGDRFLTAREAARHLGVRQASANRALQVLEHRGRLHRRQRLGAVVAEPALAPPVLTRVHMLVQEERARSASGEEEAVQVGLQRALPGCAVEVAALPAEDAAQAVERVMRAALRGAGPEGLVLVRCGYAIQRQVADSGLSAVIHGSAYPGVALASLDEDAAQKGRLQAEALLERDCRRALVLRRDRSLPGDAEFLRALQLELARAGWPADAVDLCELVPEARVVGAELHARLSAAGDGRVGIVAATPSLAQAAWSVVRERGQDPLLELPVLANRMGIARHVSCPFLRAREGPEQQGELLGGLLQSALEPGRGAPERRLISCELVA